MFRDTFAIELLLAGVPIDQVSILLGHKSVKITEKHYAPWVKARQDQLEKSVRAAWRSGGSGIRRLIVAHAQSVRVFLIRAVFPNINGSVVSGIQISGMPQSTIFAPTKPAGATPMIVKAQPGGSRADGEYAARHGRED